MNGFQISFFTVHGHRHKGKTIGDWLVQSAKKLGVTGATLISGSEGFGLHRRIHSVHFIELTDQPLEVVMVVTSEEKDRLFEFLKDEGVHVFYAMTPVEFGILGAPNK